MTITTANFTVFVFLPAAEQGCGVEQNCDSSTMSSSSDPRSFVLMHLQYAYISFSMMKMLDNGRYVSGSYPFLPGGGGMSTVTNLIGSFVLLHLLSSHSLRLKETAYLCMCIKDLIQFPFFIF